MVFEGWNILNFCLSLVVVVFNDILEFIWTEIVIEEIVNFI